MKRKHLITIIVLILVVCIGAMWLMNSSEPISDWQHQFDLGMRYLSQGDYQEAVIAFRAAIEIDPRWADAHLGLAAAYIGLGDAPSARAVLREGYDLTGDERLRDRLEELEKPDEDDTLYDDASDAETEAAEETEEAPFTPAQRALLGRISDAMRAGDYDDAMRLLEMQDTRDILVEHGDFLYRDIWFHRSPGWELQLRATIDKRQDGSGLAVEIAAFASHRSDVALSSVTIVESIDGVPNGRYERRVFEAPGGPMDQIHTGSLLNGYVHGEYTIHWPQNNTTHITTYENGFEVSRRIINSQGDRFFTVDPADRSSEPFRLYCPSRVIPDRAPRYH